MTTMNPNTDFEALAAKEVDAALGALTPFVTVSKTELKAFANVLANGGTLDKQTILKSLEKTNDDYQLIADATTATEARQIVEQKAAGPVALQAKAQQGIDTGAGFAPMKATNIAFTTVATQPAASEPKAAAEKAPVQAVADAKITTAESKRVVAAYNQAVEGGLTLRAPLLDKAGEERKAKAIADMKANGFAGVKLTAASFAANAEMVRKPMVMPMAPMMGGMKFGLAA